MDAPAHYDEFTKTVRHFKTQSLLRMLADVGREQWLRPGRLSQAGDLVSPHAASLIAFEAMGGWGRQGQTPPSRTDLGYLNNLVIGLADPYVDETSRDDPDAMESYIVRVAFQQFPYQQPAFSEMARLRPMFDRPYPRPEYKVIDATLIDKLLGTDINNYIDFGPFFLAAVMSNRGVFDPAWLHRPELAAVAETFPTALPEGAAERVFGRFTAPPAFFRAAARENRNVDTRRRQYDFNPLAAKPFVLLDSGAGLAPQPFFVTSRFTPSAVYYAGLDRLHPDRKTQNDFTKDLGTVNESYTVEQLTQLKDVGLAVAGEVEYESGKYSVDATVLMPDALLLFEVKSSRPTMPSRADLASYTKHLKRDLTHAVEQLVTTNNLWRGGHAAFTHIDQGLPTQAFIVVPEPLYQANLKTVRAALPEAPFDIAIISFTELEMLVAEALREGNGRVLQEAARPHPPAMTANVAGALDNARRRGGGTPAGNPLLDKSFDAISWG